MLTSSPLPFSHVHCGASARLSMDGLTARRVKNSSHAMVVSAAPLEPNILYQVKMKEVVGGEKPNSGCCVRIGVTSLSLDTVCGWKEWRVENDVSGNTTVLDRVPSGQLCVSSRGERLATLKDNHMDLCSLSEGESVGVMYSTDEIIFTLNGLQLRYLKHNNSPPSHKTSKPLHLFVDISGPVCAIEALPKLQRGNERLRITSLPWEITGAKSATKCPYFNLCQRFLRSVRAILSDGYFSWPHCKCYCANCYNTSVLPEAKEKGSPPAAYSLPTGWAKIGLW